MGKGWGPGCGCPRAGRFIGVTRNPFRWKRTKGPLIWEAESPSYTAGPRPGSGKKKPNKKRGSRTIGYHLRGLGRRLRSVIRAAASSVLSTAPQGTLVMVSSSVPAIGCMTSILPNFAGGVSGGGCWLEDVSPPDSAQTHRYVLCKGTNVVWVGCGFMHVIFQSCSTYFYT